MRKTIFKHSYAALSPHSFVRRPYRTPPRSFIEALHLNILKMFLVILFPFIFGCSTITHMDQLLTLKAVSTEAASMNVQVAEQDRQFEMLRDNVLESQLPMGQMKSNIERQFGEPIFITEKNEENCREMWMYRYSTQLSGSEKVYLCFDEKDKLVSAEHIPSDDK